ncbi:28S ribosomal protein S15, mitochondrial [Neodiprion virginianus]|uniref:28S ribosomal protein S15, mitochondrial n=1 Tax=Neodiprion virginianus TaxID=2961670 RepID=UPI001EE6F2F2|nr:28S ribosomal protein S15, mitochondrial [Neodiprion virginianus]
MNVLRFVPNVICSITKCDGYVARYYAFKSALKIKWVRPEKIPFYKPEKTGDLGLNLKVTSKDFAGRFGESKELQDADEVVKKLFTLEYLPEMETRKMKRNEAVALVRRHELDWGSMEAKLAKMTAIIQDMQKTMDKFPRNAILKVELNELIHKRKKFLGYLRQWDYKRFEWILEKLNLVYKPYPPKLLPVTRKDSLRKLTQKHCDEIVQKKLDAYKAELTLKQKQFFKEKSEKLAFIRQEELECELEPTITEEEIQEAKNKYESL